MRQFALPLLAFALASCNLAPDYFSPAVPEPAAYKDIDPNWTVATPAAQMPRGQWWLVFQDPMLNDLEAQVQDANQDLLAAVARFENARAAVEYARASLFPVVTGNGSALREHTSQNRPISTALTRRQYNDYTTGLDATYEVDVFGRLRNAATAAEVAADASADDLQTVNLSLHTELAADYFRLRGSEALMRLLASTAKVYAQALDLTTQRFEGGIAAEIDVQEARAQLKATQAALADATLARAQTEHAIAVLVGRPAPDFSLPPSEFLGQPPAIPAGQPSLLLQRRPDIAAAERVVAERNAQIGIARAAYFPVFDLTAEGGFEGSKNSNIFKQASEFWSFGPTLATTVLDFGQLDALDTEAHANYDEAVANYRGVVLEAYRNVEDGLAQVRYYDEEAADETAAVTAANRALELANQQYSAGIITFLNVVTSQAISLQDEATVVNTFVQQMNARVALINALGGVWGEHPDPIPLPVPPGDLGPIPQTPRLSQIVKRDYPERPFVGIGCVVWRGDEVLLVQRGKPPGLGEWGLPGGAQEVGETVLEAAAREVLEETGVVVEPLGLITVLDMIRHDADQAVQFHYTIIEIAARYVSGVVQAGDDVLDARFVAMDEVSSLAVWSEVERVVRLSRKPLPAI